MTFSDLLHEGKTVISSLPFYFSVFLHSINLTTKVLFKGYIIISVIMHLSLTLSAEVVKFNFLSQSKVLFHLAITNRCTIKEVVHTFSETVQYFNYLNSCILKNL